MYAERCPNVDPGEQLTPDSQVEGQEEDLGRPRGEQWYLAEAQGRRSSLDVWIVHPRGSWFLEYDKGQSHSPRESLPNMPAVY